MRPYSLRDVLVYRRGNHKAVLMLYAYFDESGHYRDPSEKVMVIGGCLSTLEKWTVFENEWEELLKTFQIQCFHATDLKAGEEEFKGWTEYRKRQFLQPALHVIDKAVEKYLGAVLPLEHWQQLTDEQKKQSPNPYFMCMQDVVHMAGIEAKMAGLDEKVEVIFGELDEVGAKKRSSQEIINDENEGLAYRCYKACKRELPIRDHLGTIAFDYPKNILPLQAADLVAFELTQIGRKMLGPEIPYEKYRWPFKQILKKSPEFHYYLENEVNNRLAWARREL